MNKAWVGILMGSETDKPVMEKAAKVLAEFGIPYEFKVLSAHRLPDEVAEYALTAESRGIEVLIAGAGMAAHLAGALAANTTLPVIGVPLAAGALNGMDSLLSTVQMPTGVPVATVAIDGAANAAYLGVQILARKYPEVSRKLKDWKQQKRKTLLAAAGKVSTQPGVVLRTEFAPLSAPKRGKVRDIYDLGNQLLLVATDRISVFDVVLPTGIPDKGRVLTQISLFWFDQLKKTVPSHVITSDVSRYPSELQAFRRELEGRSMLVKKAKPLPVECIVRGYLSGSGWSEYQKTGTVCGIPLPKGLGESAKLKEPIFTPSTKAETGHDQNISYEEMTRILKDAKLAKKVRDTSIALYKAASQIAEKRGIIIADTKFEFGLMGSELIWIDEALTPDSSRFWPRADYQAGGAQKSFDKQFVRDYCASLGWNKTAPGPELPSEIVEKTREKYLEALRLLTGNVQEVQRSKFKV